MIRGQTTMAAQLCAAEPVVAEHRYILIGIEDIALHISRMTITVDTLVV